MQTVARTITHTSRPFDLVGSWGGEEFVGIIRPMSRKMPWQKSETDTACSSKKCSFLSKQNGRNRLTTG